MKLLFEEVDYRDPAIVAFRTPKGSRPAPCADSECCGAVTGLPWRLYGRMVNKGRPRVFTGVIVERIGVDCCR